ncbi:hypothetical protein ASE36_21290 [Rhizobium sp. Root274]|uniref:hypothetical protein n=1 Tax=unclassified Rhizobium TaxID=2613769 RepID=UPI000712D031|nr:MULTISPECIES: hypothetical protein [unclassified Rhizobium]KQW25471.1 hypothetical protein ASC71_21350 [Rhizobium sp. Root1240]KRD26091.1 hypothetical protein ASE36_21290 [Rhizobium sp. Root274]
MLKSVSWLAVLGTALLLTSAPNATLAQVTQSEQSTEALLTISGQVVDAYENYYVVRSDGGRLNIQFNGWPEILPDRRPVLGIGDNIRAVGAIGPNALNADGVVDVIAVYVEDRNAYFALSGSAVSASDIDALTLPPNLGFGPIDGRVSLTGVIVEIDKGVLVVQTGGIRMTVESSSLNYNPFDTVGRQHLKLGDTVAVGGVLEPNATDEPRIKADRITSIFIVSAAI